MVERLAALPRILTPPLSTLWNSPLTPYAFRTIQRLGSNVDVCHGHTRVDISFRSSNNWHRRRGADHRRSEASVRAASFWLSYASW